MTHLGSLHDPFTHLHLHIGLIIIKTEQVRGLIALLKDPTGAAWLC